MDDREIIQSLREQKFEVWVSGALIAVTNPEGGPPIHFHKGTDGKRNRAQLNALAELKRLGWKPPGEWKEHKRLERRREAKARKEQRMSTQQEEIPVTPGTMGADPAISLDGAAGEARVGPEERDLDRELKDFGKWIKQLRGSVDMSQDDVGRKAEIANAQATISRIESGRGTVQVGIIGSVLSVFDVPDDVVEDKLALYKNIRESLEVRRKERLAQMSRDRASTRKGAATTKASPAKAETVEPPKPATASRPQASEVRTRFTTPANPAARAKQIMDRLETVPDLLEELKSLIDPMAAELAQRRENHKKLEQLLGKAIDII